jgi:hypothetical protein
VIGGVAIASDISLISSLLTTTDSSPSRRWVILLFATIFSFPSRVCFPQRMLFGFTCRGRKPCHCFLNKGQLLIRIAVHLKYRFTFPLRRREILVHRNLEIVRKNLLPLDVFIKRRSDPFECGAGRIGQSTRTIRPLSLVLSPRNSTYGRM